MARRKYQTGTADFTSLGMTGGIGKNKKAILAHNAGYYKPRRRPVEMYQDGSIDLGLGGKPIEVERDELIFHKTPNGRFVLRADFQGGRTHGQGGEPYVAKKGDVIFPGKQRKKVMKAYKDGDHTRLESMRMKLPKDKPGGTGGAKAQTGLDNRLGGFTNQNPYFEEEVVERREPRQRFADTTAGDILRHTVNLAPSIYDIGKNLFERPTQTQRRFYEPEPLDPYVNIEPQLRDIQRTERLRFDQARNLAGGSTARAMNAMNLAAAEAQRARGDLRTQARAVERDIRNQNIQELNRAGQINLNLANVYDDLDS